MGCCVQGVYLRYMYSYSKCANNALCFDLVSLNTTVLCWTYKEGLASTRPHAGYIDKYFFTGYKLCICMLQLNL